MRGEVGYQYAHCGAPGQLQLLDPPCGTRKSEGFTVLVLPKLPPETLPSPLLVEALPVAEPLLEKLVVPLDVLPLLQDALDEEKSLPKEDESLVPLDVALLEKEPPAPMDVEVVLEPLDALLPGPLEDAFPLPLVVPLDESLAVD